MYPLPYTYDYPRQGTGTGIRAAAAATAAKVNSHGHLSPEARSRAGAAGATPEDRIRGASRPPFWPRLGAAERPRGGSLPRSRRRKPAAVGRRARRSPSPGTPPPSEEISKARLPGELQNHPLVRQSNSPLPAVLDDIKPSPPPPPCCSVQGWRAAQRSSTLLKGWSTASEPTDGAGRTSDPRRLRLGSSSRRRALPGCR